MSAPGVSTNVPSEIAAAPATQAMSLEQGIHPHSTTAEPGFNDVRYTSTSPASDKYLQDMEKVASQPIPEVSHHEPTEPPPEYDIGEPVYQANPILQTMGQFLHSRYFIILRDFSMIGLLLGIWIPSVVRHETRHKWVITTIISWFFVLLILLHNSKYIPQRPFVRMIKSVWVPCIETPWFNLPYYVRLVTGWLCLAVLFFGTAFGIKATPEAPYKPRGIAILGIFVNYAILFCFSKNFKAVRPSIVIVGLGLQMILGLFVYKTQAGLDLFNWISTALRDLLEQGQLGGATFFWNADVVANNYFFVNTLSAILWFIAFATMMFYIGAFGWVIKKFAWFFYKLFGISGAEAVVATASPFIGQGENCILTRPFVKDFTESEIHQVLTSGFATISGSVFIAYVSLGMNGKDLLTSSMMSIPGSIAASKVICPETQRPLTMGRFIEKDPEAQDENQVPDDEHPVNTLHALSNGAAFGSKVVWLIWANVLAILSLVYTINGILAWIGEYWGLQRGSEYELSLYLIGGYIFYPYVWLLGVDGSDLMKVSRLLARKIVANEFFAYKTLSEQIKLDPNYLTPHNLRICTLSLCGFANLASTGISIGVMSAMAPKRTDAIIRLTPTSLLTGFAVTCMTAAIGGMIN